MNHHVCFMTSSVSGSKALNGWQMAPSRFRYRRQKPDIRCGRFHLFRRAAAMRLARWIRRTLSISPIPPNASCNMLRWWAWLATQAREWSTPYRTRFWAGCAAGGGRFRPSFSAPLRTQHGRTPRRFKDTSAATRSCAPMPTNFAIVISSPETRPALLPASTSPSSPDTSSTA
jgi:hypothetical protein